jgi:hypothetical protein
MSVLALITNHAKQSRHATTQSSGIPMIDHLLAPPAIRSPLLQSMVIPESYAAQPPMSHQALLQRTRTGARSSALGAQVRQRLHPSSEALEHCDRIGDQPCAVKTRVWRIASLSWNLRSDLCSSSSVHLDRVPIPCPVTSQELRNDGDVDSDRSVRVAWLEQCHRSRRTRNTDHAHTPKRVTPRTNGPGHRKDRPRRPMLGAARDVTLTTSARTGEQ